MPAFRGEDDGRVRLLAVQPLDGLAPDLRFERLPLTVFGAQFCGQHTRAAQIGLFQQTHREARLAEPAGGVDARREREAHGRSGERLIAHARLLRQREKAGAAVARGDLLQTAARDEAVFAEQRHHVRHRADRDEIAVAREHFIRVAVHGAHELERHADARERRADAAAVRLLGINDRLRLRERFAAFVMVGHDHVHAALRGVGRFFQIRNAAVHRHDERDALFRQRIDGGGVEAVPIADAVGDVELAGETAKAQVIGEQARGGDAVHVVIAVYGNVLARRHGAGETLHGIHHTGQLKRVRERFRAAAEKRARRGGIGKTPQMQDRREQRRTAGGKQRAGDLRAALRHIPVCILHSVYISIF